MTAVPAPTRRPWLLLFLAVSLVAVNLRMTITGVGPLLEQIADDQGVAPAALGALASVPLLAWALCSPLAQGISARLGVSATVSWSLVVLAVGTVWRSLPGTPVNLWLGTALIGLGLAIGNVLMPAVIKRDFGERVPLVMSVYSALLGGAGAVAAGAVVPLSQLVSTDGGGAGWRIALLATGALIPPALGVWMWANRRAATREPAAGTVPDLGDGESGSPGDRAGVRIWRDPLAWTVALYMGAQSAVFYMVSTWLAPYAASLGRSAALAGVDTMVFQLVGIVGSLLLPALAHGRLQRWAPAFLPLVGVTAWLGLLLAPGGLLFWAVLGGLSTGASLTMALTLMAVRSRTQAHAAALSGMAQSVGYLIAAAGPIAFGWLHGLAGGWAAPFGLVAAIGVLQAATGLRVGRSRFVLDRGSAD